MPYSQFQCVFELWLKKHDILKNVSQVLSFQKWAQCNWHVIEALHGSSLTCKAGPYTVNIGSSRNSQTVSAWSANPVSSFRLPWKVTAIASWQSELLTMRWCNSSTQKQRWRKLNLAKSSHTQKQLSKTQSSLKKRTVWLLTYMLQVSKQEEWQRTVRQIVWV